MKKEIIIIKVKEEEIKQKMDEFEIPFEYYDKSKARDFSMESVEKHKEHLEECKVRLQIAKDTTAEKIWLEKLEKLETELKKRYIKGVLHMKK